MSAYGYVSLGSNAQLEDRRAPAFPKILSLPWQVEFEVDDAASDEEFLAAVRKAARGPAADSTSGYWVV